MIPVPETVATRRVRDALAANHIVKELRTPRHTSLVLRPNTGRPSRGNPTGVVLMKDGVMTAFGRAWQRETGTDLVAPVSWVTEPFRVGNVNWIDIPGQGRRRLSSWVHGKEKLTALGRRYYRETGGIEYIINVPVIISIKGRDGRIFERPESTIPIEWHAAPHQSHPDFRRDMQAVITDKLPEHYTSQSIREIRVLYNKPLSEWTFDKKTVRVDGNDAFMYVRLDMPMGNYDGRHSYMLLPEAITDKAFSVSVVICVIEQLAPRLNICPFVLEDRFGEAARELYGH